MLRRFLACVMVALPVIVLSSCGPRAAGWGVVLWGEANGAPQTGAVIAVLQEPTASTPMLIAVPGQKTPREYPAGRVRVFPKKQDATAFAATYASNLTAWAVVMKEDTPPLPIRDTPKPDGKTIYRLRYQQLVKVVSRSEQTMAVKPYTDYWYELVTEDGYTGWCFGHFLHPFTATGDPTAEAQRILSQDPALARIMGTTWRPDWFGAQLARGAIDLTMFRDDVGLFPSPAEHLMKLVLPLSTFEFRYTGDPQKVGAASYAFTGTDLRIDVLDDKRINVSYRYKDQPVSGVYTVLDSDVIQIVADEQVRRSNIYDGLVRDGVTLTSSAYGTIHLLDGMRFTWEGFGKLQPSLVPAGVKGSGAVDFPLHLGKTIAADYDGVITFTFDTQGGPSPSVSFLYKAASGGLRLSTLGRDGVQDLFVTRAGLSPVVIFFTQSK